jgi:hypothetical protein
MVGGYQPARTCTGSATVGARALMSYYLGLYGHLGAANLGIYVCKDIAGSGTTSLHGEGRAADCGTNPYRGVPWLQDWADAMVAHSAELGVQCVIHNERIWSSSYPHAGWRPYGGEDHAGHAHVELTWEAARTLTPDRIRAVLTQPVPRPPNTEDIVDDKTIERIAELTAREVHAQQLFKALDANGKPLTIGRVLHDLRGVPGSLATLAKAIANVDEEVLAGLGRDLDVQDKADLLRGWLGADAAAVGSLLAAGGPNTNPTTPPGLTGTATAGTPL